MNTMRRCKCMIVTILCVEAAGVSHQRRGFFNGTQGKEYEFTGETQMTTYQSVSSHLQVEKCHLKQDVLPCIGLENINRAKSHFTERAGRATLAFSWWAHTRRNPV